MLANRDEDSVFIRSSGKVIRVILWSACNVFNVSDTSSIPSIIAHDLNHVTTTVLWWNSRKTTSTFNFGIAKVVLIVILLCFIEERPVARFHEQEGTHSASEHTFTRKLCVGKAYRAQS